MIFFDVLTYLILSLSLAFMWNFAEIFIPIRNIIAKIPYVRKPLLCPECSSFWIGLFFSFLYNPLIEDLGLISYIYLVFFKLKKD